MDPTHPGTTNVAPEPLVIQRAGFAPASRYSCLHSHSPTVHGRLAPPLRPDGDALLPSIQTDAAASSVACLSPATLSARNH